MCQPKYTILSQKVKKNIPRRHSPQLLWCPPKIPDLSLNGLRIIDTMKCLWCSQAITCCCECWLPEIVIKQVTWIQLPFITVALAWLCTASVLLIGLVMLIIVLVEQWHICAFLFIPLALSKILQKLLGKFLQALQ